MMIKVGFIGEAADDIDRKLDGKEKVMALKLILHPTASRNASISTGNSCDTVIAPSGGTNVAVDLVVEKSILIF